jgi:predicted ferric reductase
MEQKGSARARSAFIWLALLLAIAIPIGAAAASPLLAWRDPIYIIAGFAGILGLALLLLQPLLAGRLLPGISPLRSRYIHRWVGLFLVVSVVVHVGGLWITSPPDVIDALTFSSPTPFSIWGVLAMWALFATALLAAFRRRLKLRPSTWRLAHSALALLIVSGTIIHALLIEGTMEVFTKAVLCTLVSIATLKVVYAIWRKERRLR